MEGERGRAAEDTWSVRPVPDLDEIASALGEVGDEPRLQPGEQRQVALLIVELQDLSTWEEVLQGDELTRVLDKVYTVFNGIVATYGGYVDRIERGIVLCLFGNRTASELDAERAVRAALEMFDKLHNINRYLAQRGIHLEVTAGVHVGQVSVDDQGRLKGGDAVRSAVDLNRSAAVNTLLISRQTRDLVGDVFLLESLGAIHRGGTPEAQDTWRVVGLNPRGEGRWLRSSLVRRSRFVGRARAFGALHAAWETCLDPERWPWERDSYTAGRRWVAPTLMAVVGEAGSGKSRILMELRSRLTSESGGRVHILQGRADPLAHVPYGLFVNLLKRYCGIQDEDAPQVRRRKLEATTRPLFASDPVLKAYLPVLGKLVGVPYEDAPSLEGDPRAVQEEIHIALTAFLRSVALHGHRETGLPVGVFFKDLHAADERSISTLLTLLERARLQVPLFVVATWRTGYRPPRELGLVCRLQEVALGPLSHEEVGALVASMLDGFRLPLALVRQVQRLAGGNPFFVEELIRNLVDGQVLQKSGDGWVLDRPDAELTLPQSLASLILSRVDALPREVRETLVCASAVGVMFPRAVLEEVALRLGRPSPAPHLKILVDARFLRVIPAARVESLSFLNLLSREVVYGTLLPANRRLLHRLIGEAYLKIYADSLPEHYGTLGVTFAEGGEKSRAARYLALAADQALAENSNDVAVDYYRRYLELGRTGPDAQRVRLRLAQVLRRLGHLGEAAEELTGLMGEEEAPRAQPEGTRLAVDVRIELSGIARQEGRRADALAFAEEAVAVADESGDPTRRVEARLVRAKCLRQMGRWEDAAAALAEVEPLAQGQEAWAARLPSERGRLALASGHLEEAVAQLEAALRVHIARGAREAQAPDLCNLSEALLSLGRLTEARLRLAEALTLVESHRGSPLAPATRMLRGALSALSGDAAGLALIDRDLDECERRQNRTATVLGYRLRVLVLGFLGRMEEAEAASRIVRERFGPGALP